MNADIQEVLGVTISVRDSEAVSRLLNSLLADEVVLTTKTRNYHWNVVGPNFSELHLFFDSQYKALNEVVDQVAERIRSLSERPIGSLTEFLKNANLKEDTISKLDARDMLSELFADHSGIIRSLRADIETCLKHHDLGSADFVTGIMEQHEKMAWMLGAFQQ